MAIFAFVWFEVIPACLLLVFTPIAMKWVLVDCLAAGSPAWRKRRKR